jgi:hypothetical protein
LPRVSPIRIQHGQPKREKVWVPTDAEKKEKAIDRAVVTMSHHVPPYTDLSYLGDPL